MKKTIIIKKITGSIPEAVKTMLLEMNYLPKKDKIFIKPNIAIPTWPAAPYITNPEVVSGIIDYLYEIGIKDISVGDGPVPIDFAVEETFEVCGYKSMCQGKNVKLLNLDEIPRKRLKGSLDISLPEIAFTHEYINVSKFKTHYQTTVSLGLKNQKGLLAPEDKKIFHGNLHKSIGELSKIIKPSLSIIDGSNGLEGNGPVDMGTEIQGLNILVGGTDFIETDRVGCNIMGINPDEVKHLTFAEKSNEKITFLGENIEEVARKFAMPTEYWKKGNLYYWWSDYTCSRCSIIEGKIIEKLEEMPVEKLMKIATSTFITGPPKTAIPGNIKIYGLGKCASYYCKEKNYPFIKGCPPKIKDVINLVNNIIKL